MVALQRLLVAIANITANSNLEFIERQFEAICMFIIESKVRSSFTTFVSSTKGATQIPTNGASGVEKEDVYLHPDQEC